MRHFFIFNIQDNIKSLGYYYPFELFSFLETIYYGNNSNILYSENVLKQFLKNINVFELDNLIYDRFSNNYFYTKYRHRHVIRDVFRKETTIMEIHNSYIKVNTNVVMPKLLDAIKKSHSFFVCDFQNKDYYWLDEATVLFPQEYFVNQR